MPRSPEFLTRDRPCPADGCGLVYRPQSLSANFCPSHMREFYGPKYKKARFEENPGLARREYQKQNYSKRDRARLHVLTYKLANPCVDCGESDPIVLEFDHRDPSLKIMEISKMVMRGRSVERIDEEIEKCDIVCANCHKRRTAKMQGWANQIELSGGTVARDVPTIESVRGERKYTRRAGIL